MTEGALETHHANKGFGSEDAEKPLRNEQHADENSYK